MKTNTRKNRNRASGTGACYQMAKYACGWTTKSSRERTGLHLSSETCKAQQGSTGHREGLWVTHQPRPGGDKVGQAACGPGLLTSKGHTVHRLPCIFWKPVLQGQGPCMAGHACCALSCPSWWVQMPPCHLQPTPGALLCPHRASTPQGQATPLHTSCTCPTYTHLP